MNTRQVGEFTVTAVSDGVLYSNHDVILGVPPEESAGLTGIAYGQPVPLDVNSFLISHRGKLILSDAGTGQGRGTDRRRIGTTRGHAAPRGPGRSSAAPRSGGHAGRTRL